MDLRRLVVSFFLLLRIVVPETPIAAASQTALLGDRAIVSGAFASDGQGIVVGLSDGGVGVLDASASKMLFEKPAASASIHAVAVSPRGDRVATAEADSTVRIWDNGSWDEIVRLGHTAAVSSVAFSRDGRLVVSGARDGMARVWEVEHGGVVRDLQGHERAVETVAWSSADNRIVTGDAAGALRLYELGVELPMTIQAEESGGVSCVCFSSDGRMVASAGADRLIRVWHARDGRELVVLEGHRDRVTALTFEPGGTRLVSGGSEGAVRVWEVANATGQVADESDADERRGRTPAERDRDPSAVLSTGDSETIRTFEGSVTSLSFDPRGERLAITTVAGEVQVLEWTDAVSPGVR